MLEKVLKTIVQSQEKLIENDDALSEKKNILSSIKGVGDTTAIALLYVLPELGTLSPKQMIAALAGVHPLIAIAAHLEENAPFGAVEPPSETRSTWQHLSRPDTIRKSKASTTDSVRPEKQKKPPSLLPCESS